MSVTINSGVNATASHESSLTSGPLILNTPTSGGGSITIGDITGLATVLDGKLNDTNGPIGISNVLVNGVDINLLAGLFAYGGTIADFQKLADVDATATEINHLVGTTGPLQAQIDAAYSDADFTAPDLMILSSAIGVADVQPVGDVLDGTVGVGYEFGDLRAPTASLDVNTQSIINLVDPVDPQDAATKNYVDVTVAGATGGAFLPLAGGTMTGDIQLAGTNLLLDADNDSSISAAVDDEMLVVLGGAAALNLTATSVDIFNSTIENVADPTDPQDAATRNYVDTTIATASASYLLTDGTNAMGADLDAGSFRLVNVADPVDPQDAVTLNHLTTSFGLAYVLADGSNAMTGDLDLGGNNITDISDPILGTEVGDRDYNDGRYLQISNNLSDVANLTTVITNLGLSSVATSGDYNDLTNLPSVPALDDLTDVSTGTPTIVEDGYHLVWDNAGSNYTLRPADVRTVHGRTGSVVSADGDYTASQIDFIGAGGLISDNVQNALGELAVEKLPTDGSISMIGDLDMGSNRIVNLSLPLVTAPHSWTTDEYFSTAGGDGFFIRASATSASSTPTYSFAGDTNTGMWLNGSELSFSVGGNNGLSIGSATINAHSKQVKNVAGPTENNDAVNLSYLNALGVQRLLGSATGIDLLNDSAGSTTPIYTLPVGAMHIATKIIIRITSYIPGINPVDPEITVGIGGPNFNQILDTTTISLGPAGAGDQAVYLDPDQGAATPNAANTITLRLATPASGTFGSFTVDVYVLGVEL